MCWKPSDRLYFVYLQNFTMMTNWYNENTYVDRSGETELVVLTTIRNGRLTAFVITFDMVLPENKFSPKKTSWRSDCIDDLTVRWVYCIYYLRALSVRNKIVECKILTSLLLIWESPMKFWTRTHNFGQFQYGRPRNYIFQLIITFLQIKAVLRVI